jgi:hypothetical protein
MRHVCKLFLALMLCPSVTAQTTAGTESQTKKPAPRKAASSARTVRKAEPDPLAEDLKALRDEVAQQRQVMQQMQEQMRQRDEAIRQMQETLRAAQTTAAEAQNKAGAAEAAATQQAETVTTLKSDVADVKLNQTNAAISTQDDQKRIGAAESLLGRFRLSGDMRVRGESFGQDLTPDRFRARIRVRLGIDGKLGEDFTGGVYLASGAVLNGAPDFKDPISTNDTLTSFFERKTIGIDRGWITYNPQAHKWLSLTGGKFAYSWQRTVLTFDSDLNPDGFSEKASWDFSNPIVKNVTAQALQLLYNEVGGGQDSNAVGGAFQSRLQLGKRVTMTPSYTILNWNNADSIAQAANPVTLPQPNTPPVGTPLPQPTTQPVRIINANAFTNASRILGTGTNQRRAFVSGFMYSDLILDTVIKTPWERLPWRVLAEYEDNLRARIHQSHAYWLETSLGQQRNRNDFLFGYSFARIEQDAVISQFNESDMRAPTNVAQHRFYVNWLVRPNTTAAFTAWIGRTLDPNLQNAAKPAGLPAGAQDPFLKRLQLDLIYKF